MNYVQSVTFLGTILLLAACIATDAKEGGSRQNQGEKGRELPYLAQEKPGLASVVFAPGIISKEDRHEFGATFSKDGKELFFGVDNMGVMEVYHTRLENGKWSSHIKLFAESTFRHNDPMLFLNEEKLFFISNRPSDSSGVKMDVDIWYSDKRGDKWSAPINLGEASSTSFDEYFVSFTNQGAIYFASRDTSKEAPDYAFDIYRLSYKGRRFSKPVKLPEQINTPRYEADGFVAADESYLIFSSI